MLPLLVGELAAVALPQDKQSQSTKRPTLHHILFIKDSLCQIPNGMLISSDATVKQNIGGGFYEQKETERAGR
jgi:hypothetical protein